MPSARASPSVRRSVMSERIGPELARAVALSALVIGSSTLSRPPATPPHIPSRLRRESLKDRRLAAATFLSKTAPDCCTAGRARSEAGRRRGRPRGRSAPRFGEAPMRGSLPAPRRRHSQCAGRRRSPRPTRLQRGSARPAKPQQPLHRRRPCPASRYIPAGAARARRRNRRAGDSRTHAKAGCHRVRDPTISRISFDHELRTPSAAAVLIWVLVPMDDHLPPRAPETYVPTGERSSSSCDDASCGLSADPSTADIPVQEERRERNMPATLSSDVTQWSAVAGRGGIGLPL